MASTSTTGAQASTSRSAPTAAVRTSSPFAVPRIIASLFSHFPLIVHPALPLHSPPPIPLPSTPTLFVFKGHPTPRGHTWASRDPNCLRWQMELLFRSASASGSSSSKPDSSSLGFNVVHLPPFAVSSSSTASNTGATTPSILDEHGTFFGPSGPSISPPYLQRSDCVQMPQRSLVSGASGLARWTEHWRSFEWERAENRTGKGAEGESFRPYKDLRRYAEKAAWDVVLHQIEIGLLLELLLSPSTQSVYSTSTLAPLKPLDSSLRPFTQPFFRSLARRLSHLLASLPALRNEVTTGGAGTGLGLGLDRVPGWSLSLGGLLGASGIVQRNIWGVGSVASDPTSEGAIPGMEPQDGGETDAWWEYTTDVRSVLREEVIERLIADARTGLEELGRRMELEDGGGAGGWFLDATSPTPLDARLFALLHTILSQPLGPTITSGEKERSLRDVVKESPTLGEWSRRVWGEWVRPRGG